MDISKLKAGSVKLLGDGYIPLSEAAEECGTTARDLADRLRSNRSPLFISALQWRGWLTTDIRRDLDHMYDDATGELVEVVLNETRLGGRNAMTDFSGVVSVRFPEDLSSVLAGSAESAQLCQFMLWPSPSRALVCDLPGRTIRLQDILVRRHDVWAITRQLLAALPQSDTSVAISPAKPDTKQSALFSDLCKRYFQHNHDLWSKNDHKRRKIDHSEMFQQLMGDIPIDSINRKVMRDFAEKIKDIPHERHKFLQLHGLRSTSYPELVKHKLAKNHPSLSGGEQRKILETISQIFNWAVQEQELSSNPAINLAGEAERKSSGAPRKKAHEQRDQLSPEDLEKIFSATWFKTGVGKLTAKESYYHFRPHYFWLPIMALYLGGRLNELCQLYLKDVIILQDIHCIHFNLIGEGKIDIDDPDETTKSDKSLKNISSERIIPIPQFMIDLGFINYVEELQKVGHTRLFPELNFDPEKGYGKYAGKWFNDAFLGKTLKIPRNGKKTFHSMRHNFATKLGEIDARPNEKADLMGHMRKGSTADVRYDKGELSKRKQLIDKIAHPHPTIHPFNITEGIKALADALTLKRTRIPSTARTST